MHNLSSEPLLLYDSEGDIQYVEGKDFILLKDEKVYLYRLRIFSC